MMATSVRAVRYTSDSLDNPTGTPMTIPLFMIWRRKTSMIADSNTFGKQVDPHSVIMSTHQRFLEASCVETKH